MILIITGPSGSGKTTVGKALALATGFSFYDADDYHSKENIDKMARGIPLTDRDRLPWLQSIRALIESAIAHGESSVLACSALKEEYRRQLKVDDSVKIIFLKCDPAVLHERLEHRQGHYMKASMLESQLATLEEPRDAIVVDGSISVPQIVAEIRKRVT